MSEVRRAVLYAAALILLAVLARYGLADRDSVRILALVFPVLAVLAIYRGRRTRCA